MNLKYAVESDTVDESVKRIENSFTKRSIFKGVGEHEEQTELIHEYLTSHRK